MTRPNVRIEGSDIVHAHAKSEYPIARCGVEYIRNGQERRMLDNRRSGFDTEDPVDCMTCLVKDEWANASLSEIMVSNSVKKIQEAEDARYVNELYAVGRRSI